MRAVVVCATPSPLVVSYTPSTMMTLTSRVARATTLAILTGFGLGACDSSEEGNCPDPFDAVVAGGEAVFVRQGSGPQFSCPPVEVATVSTQASQITLAAPEDTLRLTFAPGGELVEASYRRSPNVVYTTTVVSGQLDSSSQIGRFKVDVSEYDAIFPVRFSLRGRFGI